MRVLQSVLKSLRTGLIILTVTFVLGEVVLRIVNWVRPSYVFYDGSYNRFRGQPGSVAAGSLLNSHGFKDREHALDKGEVFRILGLGDSFAFGVVPYEHNYLTLLEEHLTREDQPVEVINMGIPRTGPRDYLSVLIKEGLEFDPDLVLVSFYVGNDFLDSLRAGRSSRRLWEHSYVITLLRFAIFVRPGLEDGTLYGQKPYDDDAPTLSRNKYLEVEQRRCRIYLPSWTHFDEALSSAVLYLEEIQTVCQRQSIDLVVVLIPEETQLDVELQQDLMAAGEEYRSEPLDLLRPTRFLQDELHDLEIDVVDLYEPFRRAWDEEPLYKPNDSHWNIAGNRLAAEHIAEYLDPQIRDNREP